jgi:hypothetical protein
MFGNQLLDHHLSKTDRFKGALLSTHIQTLIACTGLTKKSANLADQGDHTSICSSHNDKIPIPQNTMEALSQVSAYHNKPTNDRLHGFYVRSFVV